MICILFTWINHDKIVYMEAYYTRIYMHKVTWGSSYRGENHTLLIIATWYFISHLTRMFTFYVLLFDIE